MFGCTVSVPTTSQRKARTRLLDILARLKWAGSVVVEHKNCGESPVGTVRKVWRSDHVKELLDLGEGEIYAAIFVHRHRYKEWQDCRGDRDENGSPERPFVLLARLDPWLTPGEYGKGAVQKLPEFGKLVVRIQPRATQPGDSVLPRNDFRNPGVLPAEFARGDHTGEKPLDAYQHMRRIQRFGGGIPHVRGSRGSRESAPLDEILAN
ncbi:hypothetical protein FB451DRAFT_1188506 [Mycena latifolia]|nr:hypothetical protein FB451DRAFT_1188506 [Mycena latifolia]